MVAVIAIGCGPWAAGMLAGGPSRFRERELPGEGSFSDAHRSSASRRAAGSSALGQILCARRGNSRDARHARAKAGRNLGAIRACGLSSARTERPRRRIARGRGEAVAARPSCASTRHRRQRPVARRPAAAGDATRGGTCGSIRRRGRISAPGVLIVLAFLAGGFFAGRAAPRRPLGPDPGGRLPASRERCRRTELREPRHYLWWSAGVHAALVAASGYFERGPPAPAAARSRRDLVARLDADPACASRWTAAYDRSTWPERRRPRRRVAGAVIRRQSRSSRRRGPRIPALRAQRSTSTARRPAP